MHQPMKTTRPRFTALLTFCALLWGLAAHPARAKTVSVVAFESEYGLILLDSIKSRAAFDLFENLNVPVEYGTFYQTKIFAPKDKSFRIVCTVYSLNHICAVMVYPGEYSRLDFDRDEIYLDLPASIAKQYAGFFTTEDSFHFETEDKRLMIDWSPEGFSIRNTRYGNWEVLR